MSAGPLAGVRVVEVCGIGPVPFAGMVLADLGAEVVRIDRAGGVDHPSHHLILRGRHKMLTLDLKDPADRQRALEEIDDAEILIEGFRPGVMERLGLGPAEVLARRPQLVYGRMTGFGQDGPLAERAGHDINYIAASGALEPIAAPDGTPVQPLNMLGDFGAGSMLLVTGVLAALTHARTTGEGQVVDAAIVDGSALMTTMLHAMMSSGVWNRPRGQNIFDGGCPYYGVYRTADDRWLALGAIEPQFYRQLLIGLGLDAECDPAAQHDQAAWPALKEVFAARIAERTQAQWLEVFDGVDACVTPVVAPREVMADPHLAARGTYRQRDGHLQPSPAPRFSRTPLDGQPPLAQCGSAPASAPTGAAGQEQQTAVGEQV